MENGKKKKTFFLRSNYGNIIVNAFNLGIAKSDEIFYGKAEGIGNPVVYVGSKTGRDGVYAPSAMRD